MGLGDQTDHRHSLVKQASRTATSVQDAKPPRLRWPSGVNAVPNPLSQALSWIAADASRALGLAAILAELVPIIIYAQARPGDRKRLNDAARWLLFIPFKRVRRAQRQASQRGLEAVRHGAGACSALLAFVYGTHPARCVAVSVVLSTLYMVIAIAIAVASWGDAKAVHQAKDVLERQTNPILYDLPQEVIDAANKKTRTRGGQYPMHEPTYTGPLPDQWPIREQLAAQGITTWAKLRSALEAYPDEVDQAITDHPLGQPISVLVMLEGIKLDSGPRFTLVGLLLLNTLFDLAGLFLLVFLVERIAKSSRSLPLLALAGAALLSSLTLLALALAVYGPGTHGDWGVAFTLGTAPVVFLAGLAFGIGLIATGINAWTAHGDADDGCFAVLANRLLAFPAAAIAFLAILAYAMHVLDRIGDMALPPLTSGASPNLLPFLMAASCVIPITLFALTLAAAAVASIAVRPVRWLVALLLRTFRRAPTPTYFVLTGLPAAGLGLAALLV